MYTKKKQNKNNAVSPMFLLELGAGEYLLDSEYHSAYLSDAMSTLILHIWMGVVWCRKRQSLNTILVNIVKKKQAPYTYDEEPMAIGA